MKIVISGGNGLLASNLIALLYDSHDILSLTRSKKVIFEHVKNLQVDFLNTTDIQNIISSFKPDLIINTISLTSVEKCEENYYKAYISNVQTAINIAKVAKQLEVKLVHISTDHFSDSSKKYAIESELEIPKNNYAMTKLNAEKEVLSICPNALVVRTNFFGWGHNFRHSFSDYIINNLRNKNEINLFTDVYYTPISINDLNNAIMSLVLSNANGVFNVVGNERLSKYEFGLLIAQEFCLDQNLIKATAYKNTSLTVRPTEMSLSNSKLINLLGEKFSFPILEAIKNLKESEENFKRFYSSTIFSSSLEYISYGKQSINQDDISSVVEVLNGNFLTQGPKVLEFEQRIAKYTGAKYAVAMNNLTTAMHAGVIALGLKEGDYIITSPNTFVTSSNVSLFCKAIPLFADIDPDTLNICPKSISKILEEYGDKVKIIIPVHFGGSPCDMEAIKILADKYNCKILEDAAHALGGTYLNKTRIGDCANSDITGFSFHPVKNITTAEGGALTTNSIEIYKSLLRLRSHGIIKDQDSCVLLNQAYTNGELNPWYYEMQEIGFNYRITDLQCALGISQLARLEEFHSRRVQIGLLYDKEFLNLKNLKPLQVTTRKISGNHLYVCRVDLNSLKLTKLALFKIFKEKGILLHVHYIPVTIQPFYKNFLGTTSKDCPAATDYYEHAITLPFFHSMSDEQVYSVIDAVKEIIG